MKFKARARQSTTAQLHLSESISSIHTLNKWRVVSRGTYTLNSSGSKRYLYVNFLLLFLCLNFFLFLNRSLKIMHKVVQLNYKLL